MRAFLLSLGCAIGAALAQSPAHQPVAPGDLPRLGNLTGLPTQGLLGFDTDREGTCWAAAARYKAAFTADAAQYYPALPPDAAPAGPLELKLTHLTVAGEALACGAPERARHGNRITYDYGHGLAQCFEVSARGIEQSFHFAALPRRGALEIRIAATGDYAAEPVADGIAFRTQRGDGGVHYGLATAIDAAGSRAPVAERCEGGTLVLTVDAAFVAQAELPLVVDPLIGPLTTVVTDTVAVTPRDIVFLSTRNEYWICYERKFSALDSDVYVVRCDANLAPIGTHVIDATAWSWRAPRMAGLTLLDRCLVVAEVSSGQVTPFKIGGRILNGGGGVPTAWPAFDIQDASIPGHQPYDALNPDVGGDSGLPGDQWPVVWESTYTQTDHDICMRAVRSDGTLSTLLWHVDLSNSLEHHPTISKANGSGPAPAKYWAIAYRRDFQGGTGQMRFSIADWNASLSAPPGGFPVGPVTTTTDGGWSVSSPLEPLAGQPSWPGPFLLAETALDSRGQRQVRLSGIDLLGNVVAAPQDVGLSGDSPRATCDGRRFQVAYRRPATPVDDDVRVATLALVQGAFLVQDHVLAAASADVERTPCITSCRDGGLTTGSNLCALAWTHGLAPANQRIEVVGYAGMASAGGVSLRSTGCGGLQIQASGNGALGTGVGLALTNAGSLAGFGIGFPVQIPLALCPGCTQGSSALSTVLGVNHALDLNLPPVFVGLVLAVQGFDFANGPCLNQIRLSDTVDVTIR